MLVNPDKLQAIGSNKKLSDLAKTKFSVDNEVVKPVSSVELLDIQKDDKLNFNKCVNKTKQFLSFHAIEILTDSYIRSDFNYCLRSRYFQVLIR